MREEQTITFYQRVFLQPASFKKRIENLNKIRSYHVLPLNRVDISGKNVVKIIYQQQWRYHLDQFIKQNKEILPSQIKCLVMQIVKAMVDSQKLKINHFRLCPKAITLSKPFNPFSDNDLFLKLKDFSFGNEFKEVKEGKLLQFFDFLHPDLSLKVVEQNFLDYSPQYDIWSLGIIVYKLIYFKNPFAKQGRIILSKTLLRKYLTGEYEIPFYNNKFLSLNNFIKKCLTMKKEGRFNDWTAIKYFILQEEEIYNNFDFYDCNFIEIAQQHIQLMYLFSSIYIMIFQQSNNSPHYFWKISTSQNIKTPFVTLICEAILILMAQLNSRFQKVFSSHKFMLKGTNVQNSLDKISSSIANEINFKKQLWQEPLFNRPFNFMTIKKILQICARAKMQMFQVNALNSKLNRLKFGLFGYATKYKYDSHQKRILWKNIEVLYDFCHEVIDILNACTNRTKQLYEKVYTSSLFGNLAINFFGFKEEHNHGIFKNNI